MAATGGVRDNLCNLAPVQIPRPKCEGFHFITTRGRQGFYKSIRANGDKYGIAIKPQGPRRPMLHDDLFKRRGEECRFSPATLKEEDSDGTVSPTPTQITMRHSHGQRSDEERSDRSSRSSQMSETSQRSSPVELEPDYPDDYVPPQLPPPRTTVPSSQRVIKF